jgi:mitotic spindle assembly checkpoint protein MAD2
VEGEKLIFLYDSATLRPEADVEIEIRNVLKAIVTSDGFLPTLEDPTVFNILAYSKAADIPGDWEETHLHGVEQEASDNVKLRDFSTNIHKIGLAVAYRE